MLKQCSKEKMGFTRGVAPSWQHVGCRFLCYPSLAELYYRSIDLDRDFKVAQEVLKNFFKINLFFR